MADRTAPRRRSDGLLGLIPRGMFQFLSVGVTGLAIHNLLFTLLRHLGLAKSSSWLIALCMATTVTWALNRRVTFAASGRSRTAEITRYAIVTLVAQGISFTVFLSMGVIAPHLPENLALNVGAAVATIFSYTGQRFFTFAAPKTADGETVISDIPVI